MKKITKLFFLVLVLALTLTLFACGGSEEEGIKITVWTSEVKGVADLTKQQIKDFADEQGIKINATVSGVGEKKASSEMLKSVETGADLFFFAQDQLARLVQAAALSRLNTEASEKIKAENDADSVAAATVRDKIWAYPLTNDNSFIMYYDKSVIAEEHLGSMEAIIEDCKANNRQFSFNLEKDGGWYNAGFFFATGCKSNWTVDTEGNFIEVDDDFNSANGLIALKGMQKLLKSGVWNNTADAAQFAAGIKSAVVISGTWDKKSAEEALGKNFGVAELPSFEVDGQSYHLKSFRGSKLLGVKPQTDPERTKLLRQLATYLVSEKCQKERFDLLGWGPSNINLQNSKEVKEDKVLDALTKQYAYAVNQGQIPANWWSLSESYVAAAIKAELGDEEALKAALKTYEEQLQTMLKK